MKLKKTVNKSKRCWNQPQLYLTTMPLVLLMIVFVKKKSWKIAFTINRMVRITAETSIKKIVYRKEILRTVRL